MLGDKKDFSFLSYELGWVGLKSGRKEININFHCLVEKKNEC